MPFDLYVVLPETLIPNVHYQHVRLLYFSYLQAQLRFYTCGHLSLGI
jgi:hypothetical protein